MFSLNCPVCGQLRTLWADAATSQAYTINANGVLVLKRDAVNAPKPGRMMLLCATCMMQFDVDVVYQNGRYCLTEVSKGVKINV